MPALGRSIIGTDLVPASRTSIGAVPAPAHSAAPRTIATGVRAVFTHHDLRRAGDLDRRARQRWTRAAGRAESMHPAIVDQRLQAGDAERHVHHPFAPRAAERVRDDDADRTAEAVARASARSRSAEPSGSRGRTVTQPAGDVRCVHARIRADESMAGLGDQDATIHPHDPPRLARGRPRPRADPCRARPPSSVANADGATPSSRDDRVLGLRHDLLRDDEDVARLDGAGIVGRGSTASAISRARSAPRRQPPECQAPRRR